MKPFDEPRVYLIGSPQTHGSEVRRWLDSIGAVDYDPPAVDSHGDRLVSLAGRRCYMSFDVSLNRNLTRIRKDTSEYIGNILEVGHGCYDGETEVLTVAGWKQWPDVTKDDGLATLSRQGVIEYQQPTSLIAAPYSGKMYRVDGRGVDLLVTPNHRMYVCQTTTREGRKRNLFDFTTADELGGKAHCYTKAGLWAGGAFADEDIARLLGFAIGDGHLEQGSRRLRFHLRRERKIIWMTGLLNRIFFRDSGQWTPYSNATGSDRWDVTLPEKYLGLFRAMYDADREKVIPQAVLTGWNGIALAGLFEGLMQADGSEGKTGDSFDTTSRKLADQFQQLCLHVGLAANEGYTYGAEERPTSFGDKPLTRMHVIRRGLKPEVNRYIGHDGKTSWIDDWSGDVYCAQVPNGTIYVRRNGKPVWCGNSVLEHAMYNFALEGVSRVFTGEMNRHRAGMAISEGSMRFIRFNDIAYWVPKSIQDDHRDDPVTADKKARARAVFERAFRQDEENYVELEAIWKAELDPDSPFKDKKAITSMMRRIVGMGCATGGVWSGNIRALRHVFNMRCAPEAEEEILFVASTMLKEVAALEPNFFGDFEQDERGFWRPKYPKV